MSLLASGLWFGLVGIAAALTHAAVYALAQLRLLPELANALGFAVAFGVSFAGHRRLSFPDTRVSVPQSLLRFLPTAVAGFAVNETVFTLLLRLAAWPAWAALFCAMAMAALLTFTLARFWAFRA